MAGIATFASPAVALGLQPKPATAAAADPSRPVIVMRTITRKVIVRQAARPSGVRYVYAGGGTGATTPSSGAPAPPPPATTTGGS